MKTLIIGDLHGNLEIAKHAIEQRTTDKVLFMGDYLDSFNRDPEDQIETLRDVLDACEDMPERFTGLLGNHELSYLDHSQMCSGFSRTTDKLMVHLKKRTSRVLKNYVYVGDFLCTHAGVSQSLLDGLEMTLEEYLAEGTKDPKFFMGVGRSRGGYSTVGGLFWCDWTQEFVPVRGTPQIVGHSHYRYNEDRGFRQRDLSNEISYNVDCLPQMSSYVTGDEARVAVVDEELGIVVNENLFDL